MLCGNVNGMSNLQPEAAKTVGRHISCTPGEDKIAKFAIDHPSSG
jgi:hypothetical protein